MKKLTVFLILSLIFHALFALIAPKPSEQAQKQPTRIEVVTKDPEEVPPPEPTEPPKPPEPIIADPVPVQPRPEPIPPVPEPVVITPEPQTPEPVVPVIVQPSDIPTPIDIPEVEPIIKPQQYDPENPPAIASFGDFLKERSQNNHSSGPDRPVDDIARDWLEQNGGDDAVSFHEIPIKYDSYFYQFSRSLYAVWRYPDSSARNGESGIVRVTFSILRDGRITNINMLESSGYSELDREVMRTLRTMEPVPLPQSFEKEQMNINGFFIYSLNGSYLLY